MASAPRALPTTWGAEVLGLAALLSTPVATCYAGRLLSQLAQSLESIRGCDAAPNAARLGPAGLGLLALQAGDDEDDILQYSNATFRRNSNSGCSVATVDTDEDLDFCLLTPQQALGALGEHAPNYTKVYLNGLPFMADAADPNLVLSVDEVAHRVRATACRGRGALSASRATSLPSSPCRTPPPERELPPLSPLPSLQPLQSLQLLHCESSASSCASAVSDCGTACSSTSLLRSPASSISAFSQVASSTRSSFEADRAGAPIDERNEIVGSRMPTAGVQKGGAEGSLPATPHGPSPAGFPSPAQPLGVERRRSPSNCGGGAVVCGAAAAAASQSDALDASPLDYAPVGSGLERSCSTSVAAGLVAIPTVRLPHRPVPGAPCLRTASRALSSDAVRPHFGSSPALAAPPPLPQPSPLPLLHHTSSTSAALASLPLGAAHGHALAASGRRPMGHPRTSMDDSVLALTYSQGRAHAEGRHGHDHAQGLHRAPTAPTAGAHAGRPPLPPRACAASFRHGSGLVPPRPPRPLAAATAVAAAAAAAAAPVGLCRAPALPLPPDADTPDSTVPPALRYYLAQARAAGVEGSGDGAAATVAAEPAGSNLAAEAAAAPAPERAAVQSGFVRATVAQFNMQRAQALVCCHITPFPAGGTPRKPRPMSQGGGSGAIKW